MVLTYSVENAVRKSPDEPPTHVLVDRRTSEGRRGQRVDCALHLDEERVAQTGSRVGVVCRRLVQLVLGELVEDDRKRHRSRARASRKTSSARRPRDESASSSTSRRRASSIQSRRFSSSVSASRLSKSVSARRARSATGSFRASVSRSGRFTRRFYRGRFFVHRPASSLALRGGHFLKDGKDMRERSNPTSLAPPSA